MSENVLVGYNPGVNRGKLLNHGNAICFTLNSYDQWLRLFFQGRINVINWKGKSILCGEVSTHAFIDRLQGITKRPQRFGC
jgi:hypothetical protein